MLFRSNVSTNIVDVKIPFLGWQNGVQVDSSASSSYLFLDNASSLEVVGIDVDSFGVITDARYRELSSLNGVESVKAANPTAISIFPMPVNNASVAIVSGLNAGNYTTSIVNVAGQQVYTQAMQANNNGMLMMNIGQLTLTNGFYVASVRNAAGEVVASRKFHVTK